MGINFIPNFNVNDVLQQVRDDLGRIEKDIYTRFQIVGDQFVNDARSQPKPPGYGDRTGNLRSSTGYIIFKDGEPVREDFGDLNREGYQTGHDLAMEIEVPVKGYCLVVVAGMKYAAAVESKGYDVISTSALIADKNLEMELKSLMKKYK